MIEDELLARLRANPLDEETRAVYADWLEQQGLVHRAAFLRAPDLATRRTLAIADPSGASWRALVTRQPITRCGRLYRQGCSMQWEHLATTVDDQTRHCRSCERDVTFCTTLEAATNQGRARECVVIDLALDDNEAKDWYDQIA